MPLLVGFVGHMFQICPEPELDSSTQFKRTDVLCFTANCMPQVYKMGRATAKSNETAFRRVHTYRFELRWLESVANRAAIKMPPLNSKGR